MNAAVAVFTGFMNVLRIAMSVRVVVVRMGMSMADLAAVGSHEGQKKGTEYIERRHPGGEHADPVHPWGVLVRGLENHVFAVVAGKKRESGDREAGTQQRDAGDGNLLRQ